MANDKLAVLIDADNAQAARLPELLSEVARYGTATVKRAYGDWTTPNLKTWKEMLHKHAVQPVQQFRYTTGKNATDSALIIDAMDLLYTGHLHGFCLVSSDSDFTRLATRLRESGVAVYGFGEKKTPEPFVAACDKFIYTEILQSDANAVVPQSAADGQVTETSAVPAEPVGAPARALETSLSLAIESNTKENGWAAMGAVGAMMQKIDPAFDPRNFGYPKLGALVRAQPFAEVKEVPTGDGSTSASMCACGRRLSRKISQVKRDFASMRSSGNVGFSLLGDAAWRLCPYSTECLSAIADLGHSGNLGQQCGGHLPLVCAAA